MSNLTKAERAQIKSLMKEDRWNAVTRFVSLKLDQWRAQSVRGASAFEELRALHLRDGAVEGLTEFFDQLERQAFDDV